jgi:hypothetical protein
MMVINLMNKFKESINNIDNKIINSHEKGQQDRIVTTTNGIYLCLNISLEVIKLTLFPG